MGDSPARPQEGVLRRRLNALLQDKRPWKARLLPAAACAFAFFFTVAFFGPVELTAYNAASLGFGVREVWLLLAAVVLAGTALAALALSALRGRLYDGALSVFFAVTAGCYLQANFLNGSLGELTGDRILWEQYALPALANFLFWAVLVLAVGAACYFSRAFWRRLVLYGCVLLVLMQTAGLASIAAQGLLSEKAPDRSYLSTENLYDYSSGKNIVVILLDRLDVWYLNQVLGEDPGFFSFLDGFTRYTNAISPYMRTLPGANAILTGYAGGVYQTPVSDYFEASWDWEDRRLLADLTGAGYTIDLYAQRDYLFGDGPTAETYVRNAVPQQSTLHPGGVLRALLRVSAYRAAPDVFKPLFWTYTDALRRLASPQEDRYEIDDIAFSNGLWQTGAGQEQPSFRFIHMNGPHEPFTIRADGTLSDTVTSAEEQTEGCFRILKELFSRMKQLGIYEDAAILITADHGHPPDDMAPLDRAILIGMFYKPSGSAGTPLAYSAAPVSNVNIPATILKNAGADYSAYGPALDEIGEGDEPVRYFYKSVDEWLLEDGSSCGEVYVYQVGADAADFSSWRIVDVYPVTNAFF